jgi:molybdopterin-guanine dinucleotide biosynthesis protein B
MSVQDNEYIVPTVSIVGWSGSGKTLFVVDLIENLVKKGYKIATLKHNAYKFQMDKPGKDSYRHKEAGAKTVIISSKEKIAVIKEVEEEQKVVDLINKFVDDSYDLAIVEGFKSGDLPKIEIYRPNLQKGMITNNKNLIKRIVNDTTEEELLSKVEEVSNYLINELINR